MIFYNPWWVHNSFLIEGGIDIGTILLYNESIVRYLLSLSLPFVWVFRRYTMKYISVVAMEGKRMQ